MYYKAEAKYFFLFLSFIFICLGCENLKPDREYRVIAHRGFWNIEGSSDNSLASLREAVRLGVDGVEIDIYPTKDDSLLVVHGPKHGGFFIADATYSTLREIHLSNGEVVPTLTEYLSCVKRYPEITLFIELKSSRLVEEVVKKIVVSGIHNHVYYMSFILNVCKELLYIDSSLEVLYLGSNLEPEVLKELHLAGFNYDINVLKKNPDWVKRATDCGLITNAWVVKYESELIWCATHHLDYITTDIPVQAKSFLSEYE